MSCWLWRRQLLSRLCLVREELAVVAADIGGTNPAQAREYAEARAAYQKLVPMGTAAFLKELFPVGSVERRCGVTCCRGVHTAALDASSILPSRGNSCCHL